MASKKRFKCPNCESEFYSTIKFWKGTRNTDIIDAYVCHDCEQITDPITKKELSSKYQPVRVCDKTSGQMDIFGKIKNLQDIINPVPMLVESPAGFTIGVMRVPQDSPNGYAEEATKMLAMIQTGSRKPERPYWYKYRNIKRGKM